MTSVREFLIIYGGYENNTGEECNEIWSYNTIRGEWKRHKKPIGIKDTCISSSICSDGKLVYIFGGEGFNDGYQQTNSILSFDITNATWDIVYPHTTDYDLNTPPPMCENLFLYHKRSLYVLGGFHDNLYHDKIYKFCLKSSTWSLIEQNGLKPSFVHQIYGTVYKNQ
ncbi:Kelch domain-containing protein 4 [Thelohanellus kitauei]|uniref:Kelch domain-containing protein 4 n=1 Tax=Thelohanellus kitauei TaxID=669202 RepID=A0A0C2NE88_THEKT|nr:Kelch domain-containing protein 4 [Thelohanellus kitauei]